MVTSPRTHFLPFSTPILSTPELHGTRPGTSSVFSFERGVYRDSMLGYFPVYRGANIELLLETFLETTRELYHDDRQLSYSVSYRQISTTTVSAAATFSSSYL